MLAEVSEWGLSDAIVVGLITFASSAIAAWVGRRSKRERDADVLATLEPAAVSMWERQERHIEHLETSLRDCLEQVREMERKLEEQ